LWLLDLQIPVSGMEFGVCGWIHSTSSLHWLHISKYHSARPRHNLYYMNTFIRLRVTKREYIQQNTTLKTIK